MPTGNIKFSQLPNLTTITAATYAPVVDAFTNYTVTMSNVTSFVNQNSTDITATGNVLVGGLVSATGDVQGANLFTGGLVSATGDVQGANVLTAGLISAGGNITGDYILGNGSQLTGLPATYGNAEVATFLADFGSNVVSSTGNVTAGYFIGNGSELTGLPPGYSNAEVATFLADFGSNVISTSGDITGGNLLSTGLITSTGNVSAFDAVTASRVFTNDVISAGGNVIGSNVFTAGAVSASGNITGNYILGNGSQLTGITTTYGNTQVATFLADFGSNAISTTGNITGGNLLSTGLISSAGNIKVNANSRISIGTANIFLNNVSPPNVTMQADAFTMAAAGGPASLTVGSIFVSNGNLEVFSGSISALGNVTGGNVLTGGLISATGNITGANISGTNIRTTGLISATGNITGGNVSVTAALSVTGNILTSKTITPIVTTVGSLPTAYGTGSRATVTDATSISFRAVAIGGGANTVPVFWDGSTWRIG